MPLCGNSPCGAAAEIAALLLLPPAAQGRNSPPWCRFLWFLSFGQQKKGTPSSRGKILRRLRLLRMTALRAVRVVEDADPYKKACVYAHRRGGNDVPGRARIPPALACSGHPPLGKGGFVAGGQWPSVRQKDRRKKDLIHRKRSPCPPCGARGRLCAHPAPQVPLTAFRSGT